MASGASQFADRHRAADQAFHHRPATAVGEGVEDEIQSLPDICGVRLSIPAALPLVKSRREGAVSTSTREVAMSQTPRVPPVTRYAKSGDVRIAYQVVGEGPSTWCTCRGRCPMSI